jgi:hypothetical protein
MQEISSFWAWGVGAGRVTKTSFSINPNNTDLKPFKTQRHQACISTVGAAWAVPNGLSLLLQGDQTNLAVLGLLNTTISRQLDQQEEQNKILEKQVNHMINKENSSKNCVKNLHEATIKMILFASAMDNEEVPDNVTDSCKRFMNSKSVAFVEQELNQQFKTRGMSKVSFTTGYTANMYAGSFLWSSGETPSNHSPFAFSEVKPIKAAEHKNHQQTLQLVLTQGRGLTLDKIKASNKQEVSAPMNFNEMKEQVQMFTIANNIFFGDLSVGSQSLRALLRMMKNNKLTFKVRERTDEKFPTKFLFAVDSRFQLWLKDCRKATSQNKVNNSLIDFSALISNVLLSSFHMELPPTFAMKDPTPEPAATGKGGGRRPDLEDDKREDGKKRKKEDKKCNLIKNKSPHKKICMLTNKIWVINFTNKHFDKRPKWTDKCIMCPRWFLQKYCFSNCKHKDAHVPAAKVPLDKLAGMKTWMKLCQGN